LKPWKTSPQGLPWDWTVDFWRVFMSLNWTVDYNKDCLVYDSTIDYLVVFSLYKLSILSMNWTILSVFFSMNWSIDKIHTVFFLSVVQSIDYIQTVFFIVYGYVHRLLTMETEPKWWAVSLDYDWICWTFV